MTKKLARKWGENSCPWGRPHSRLSQYWPQQASIYHSTKDDSLTAYQACLLSYRTAVVFVLTCLCVKCSHFAYFLTDICRRCVTSRLAATTRCAITRWCTAVSDRLSARSVTSASHGSQCCRGTARFTAVSRSTTARCVGKTSDIRQCSRNIC